MKTPKMIEAMSYIDDDLVSEAITYRKKKNRGWIRWGAMAACFCLLAAVVASDLFPGSAPTPSDNHRLPVHHDLIQNDLVKNDLELSGGTEHTVVPQIPWTIHYNEVTSRLSAHRAFIKGAFTETLSDAELAALMPGADLACSGYAGFDNYGNLLDVVMQTETTLPESPVTIGLADYCFGFDYVLSGDEVVSVCNGVDYRVYQYTSGNTVELSAYALINDIYFIFAMEVPQDDLEQARGEFHRVLECFAHYGEGRPDLSAIVPEEIPELMEQMFTTLSEAQSEPDFGRYLPSELPAGFEESAIRRFRFQNSNYLSGLWSKGLDDLTWVISPFTEEDAHRLTSVKDRKNYDLSLYPIPRADSVPDELREIVDDPIFEAEELTLETVYSRAYRVDDAGDTDGWRMRFSVRYGDIIVAVSAKGVAPEWVYQQLAALIPD